MTRALFWTAIAFLVMPTVSYAVTSCKVHVNSKTGVIDVFAGGISGPLVWGDRSGTESKTFANAATCISGTSASKCEFGAPDTVEAITPPDLCTVYLKDSGAECAVHIKGCTPGIRFTDQAKANALQQLVSAVSFHHSVPTIEFSGVNVQIDSGSGRTDGPVNGSGNLIVGYNEPGICSLSGTTCQTDADCPGAIFCIQQSGVTSGSHNVIVGANHTYGSYGGLVVGLKNTIGAPYASVSGGFQNSAAGNSASVSGGAGNTASGAYTSVSGGSSTRRAAVGHR